MTQEQMLALAVDQAWRRLQRAYELETLVYEQIPAIDLFNEDLERFKVLTRHIVECERIWRRASDDLVKCRKSMAAEAEAEAAQSAVLATAPEPAPTGRAAVAVQPLRTRVASASAFEPAPDDSHEHFGPPLANSATRQLAMTNAVRT